MTKSKLLVLNSVCVPSDKPATQFFIRRKAAMPPEHRSRCQVKHLLIFNKSAVLKCPPVSSECRLKTAK